jgi:hypothetical protein
MDNTSPLKSIEFNGSVSLATNFSVAKLWLMDVTDPSDPLVFFEFALANVNGKVRLRNIFKTGAPAGIGREVLIWWGQDCSRKMPDAPLPPRGGRWKLP